MLGINGVEVMAHSAPSQKNIELSKRLTEIAAAVLSGAKDRKLNKTNLNKALFYLDLYSLCHWGKTLSDSPYMALEMGPVVAKYKQRLVKPLVNSGLAEELKEGMAEPLRLIKELENFEFLNERAIQKAKEFGLTCSQMSAAEISKRSHLNPGWAIAYANGLKKRQPAKPINLLIAMQELDDQDVWVDQKLTMDEKASVTAAEAGKGEVW